VDQHDRRFALAVVSIMERHPRTPRGILLGLRQRILAGGWMEGSPMVEELLATILEAKPRALPRRRAANTPSFHLDDDELL
jgi:hypothetical protein